MSNQTRLQTRKPYLFPELEVTRCPKLDPVAKQLLQREQKQADASLAKLRTFILDAVAPIVQIVEESQKGMLSGDQAAEAARAALALLGNASTQVSKERCRKVILGLNKKVHPLAEDEDAFAEAAPLLLGKVFETRMMAHLESLKCLSASREKDRDKYFRQGHSQYPPRGSGNQRRRGGNRYTGGNHQRRFQPYTSNREKENFQNQRTNRGKNQ